MNKYHMEESLWSGQVEEMHVWRYEGNSSMISIEETLRDVKKKIIVIRCDRLMEIAHVENVYELVVTNCVNLKRIHHLKNVKRIVLSSCKKLEYVGDCENLIYLRFDDGAFETPIKIDHVPNLTIMKCSENELKSVENAPKLTIVQGRVVFQQHHDHDFSFPIHPHLRYVEDVNLIRYINEQRFYFSLDTKLWFYSLDDTIETFKRNLELKRLTRAKERTVIVFECSNLEEISELDGVYCLRLISNANLKKITNLKDVKIIIVERGMDLQEISNCPELICIQYLNNSSLSELVIRDVPNLVMLKFSGNRLRAIQNADRLTYVGGTIHESALREFPIHRNLRYVEDSNLVYFVNRRRAMTILERYLPLNLVQIIESMCVDA